jgi:hypothetical protein
MEDTLEATLQLIHRGYPKEARRTFLRTYLTDILEDIWEDVQEGRASWKTSPLQDTSRAYNMEDILEDFC